MRGSLALRHGVLYVGRHEATAHVRPFDLDGQPLSPGFSFRGPNGAPATLAGLDVDVDHQLWIADAASSSLRRFTLFGREVASVGHPAALEVDARGSLVELVDLEVVERDGALGVWIASGGWRRHAVQRVDENGQALASLRSEGDPRANFHGVSRIATSGSRVFVCEAHAGRVQVFREQEFEFMFKLPSRSARGFEPAAIAPLADGRSIVAAAGETSALVVLDRSGRVERVLAESGGDTGQVFEPSDVVVDEGGSERETRIAVIDRDAERVQVFTLEGRCAGALSAMPGD